MKKIKKNIFYSKNNIQSLDKKKIIKSLNKSKYVILRGLFNKPEITKVLNNIKKSSFKN